MTIGFKSQNKYIYPLQNDFVTWLEGNNSQSDHQIIPYILLQSMMGGQEGGKELKFGTNVSGLVLYKSQTFEL